MYLVLTSAFALSYISPWAYEIYHVITNSYDYIWCAIRFQHQAQRVTLNSWFEAIEEVESIGDSEDVMRSYMCLFRFYNRAAENNSNIQWLIQTNDLSTSDKHLKWQFHMALSESCCGRKIQISHTHSELPMWYCFSTLVSVIACSLVVQGRKISLQIQQN